MMDLLVAVLTLTSLLGGLLVLFAARRYSALWLALATFFNISRILDLALFRLPELAILSAIGRYLDQRRLCFAL